jgi:hypothetical protein
MVHLHADRREPVPGGIVTIDPERELLVVVLVAPDLDASSDAPQLLLGNNVDGGGTTLGRCLDPTVGCSRGAGGGSGHATVGAIGGPFLADVQVLGVVGCR